MKKFIVLLIVGCITATVMGAMAADGPAEIKLSSKMGDVTFSHAKHQSKIAECTECHHKGLETPKCTSCHGVKAGIPDAKKVFHAQCKGCHAKSGGPTKCKDCHVK
ncbi:cytochrome c3 family protein [Geopsychrobacter electrodiphilus]|uniref:cytochrome c3 family protein n=1 Tax=Geopsychrobacter electrodiphilus TaxID=225196 RepID=UPI00036CA50D|nr:cytochrome c3 family protein [Geopsychrobacter electrodiphilus]